MPIFDFLCLECENTSEILVAGETETPHCRHCGSSRLKKMLSAPSSLSGTLRAGFPGAGDTACCGSSPGHAGCAGPGSCCGKQIY